MISVLLKKQLNHYRHGMLIWGGFIQIIQGIGIGIAVAQFIIPFLPLLYLPVWIAPLITVPAIVAINFSQHYWDIDNKFQRIIKRCETLDDPYGDLKELWGGVYNWEKESREEPAAIKFVAQDFHEGLEGRFLKYNDILSHLRKSNIGKSERLEEFANLLRHLEKEYFTKTKFHYGSGDAVDELKWGFEKHRYKMLYRKAYNSYKIFVDCIKPLINIVLGVFFATSLYNLLSSVVAIGAITAAFPYATAVGITLLAISGWLVFQLSESSYQPRFAELAREIKDKVNENRDRIPFLNWRFKQLLIVKKLDEFHTELHNQFKEHFIKSDQPRDVPFSTKYERRKCMVQSPVYFGSILFWKNPDDSTSEEPILIPSNKSYNLQ